MSKRELHVELLLGQKVFAMNGLSLGRLEEIRTESNRGHFYVTEFLVGKYAVLERLAAWRIGRALLHVFGARQSEGYSINCRPFAAAGLWKLLKRFAPTMIQRRSALSGFRLQLRVATRGVLM